MTDDVLDLGLAIPKAPPTPAPRRWSEAEMLALLEKRYGRTYPNGPNQALRYVGAPHVRLQPGFSDRGRQRIADYLAIDTWASSGHAVHGHEVKVSRSDLLVELKQPEKAEAFSRFCDYWWLVIPTRDLVPVTAVLPAHWGIMVVEGAGSRGGESLRVTRQSRRREDREPMPLNLVASFARSIAHLRTKASS